MVLKHPRFRANLTAINWTSLEDRFLDQPQTYGIRIFETGVWEAALDPSAGHPGWRNMATGVSEKDV